MKLEILTPDHEIFSGEVSLVQLPGSDGLFELLKNHAPMVAALTKGKIKAENEEGVHFYEINGGIVEVLKNKVLVLAE